MSEAATTTASTEAKPAAGADSKPGNQPPGAEASAGKEVSTTETKGNNDSPRDGSKPSVDATKPAEAKDASKETNPTETKAVPEKYELKLPEGAVMGDAYLEKIAAFAKAQGFSNAQAQSALELVNSAKAEVLAEQEKGLENNVDVVWPKQIVEDKEIGGANVKENIGLAAAAYKKFGSDEFNKILSDSGLVNHPEIVRLGYRIAKAMAPDSLVIPSHNTPGEKKTMAESFYGGSTGAESTPAAPAASGADKSFADSFYGGKSA